MECKKDEKIRRAEMRESCLNCVRKHIAQALILMTESKLGHPNHKWLAIGHLAEAEAETVQISSKFANKIREKRLELTENNYNIDLEALIKEAGKIKELIDRD